MAMGIFSVKLNVVAEVHTYIFSFVPPVSVGIIAQEMWNT